MRLKSQRLLLLTTGICYEIDKLPNINLQGIPYSGIKMRFYTYTEYVVPIRKVVNHDLVYQISALYLQLTGIQIQDNL